MPIPDEVLNDPDFKAWIARANEELLPKIRNSAITMIQNPGDPDPQQALEFGFMILLDKPILVMAVEGEPVGERLARAADVIVVIPTGATQEQFSAALSVGLRELADKTGVDVTKGE